MHSQKYLASISFVIPTVYFFLLLPTESLRVGLDILSLQNRQERKQDLLLVTCLTVDPFKASRASARVVSPEVYTGTAVFTRIHGTKVDF